MPQIRFDNETLSLSGVVSFHNVMHVLAESQTYFNQSKTIAFDLAQMQSSDSAGVALLFEWIKLANHHQQSFSVKALPRNVLTLLQAARIESLLTS